MRQSSVKTRGEDDAAEKNQQPDSAMGDSGAFVKLRIFSSKNLVEYIGYISTCGARSTACRNISTSDGQRAFACRNLFLLAVNINYRM